MSAAHDVRPYGSRAFLVTPGGGVSPASYARAVVRPEVADVVPAAATVLVVLRSSDSRNQVADWLRLLSVDRAGNEGREDDDVRSVVIDVVYDGEDLAAVAAASGLAVETVVSLHTGAEYTCEFCGFAPGFGYLSGLPDSLVLPRRSTPRTSVPAGSVAIAGPYSAVYPSASPGGWHLLGHTDSVLWDLANDSPALLTPGTRVTFRAIRGSSVPESGRSTTRSPGEKSPAQIRVVAAGIASSMQDRGRVGYAHLGVPHSGALDAALRDLVNRLVGNVVDDAVIETAGGLVLEAVEPIVVADSSSGVVRTLSPREQVTVDPREDEMWAYLAVRGGFDIEPVLGSRSWDSLAKLGPVALERGDLLRVGPDPRTDLTTDLAPPRAHAATLRVHPGPRLDWFADDAFDHVASTEWTVSADVSRVGVRLRGASLLRHPDRVGEELPSEGLVTGAIQVPPDGEPLVMLNDHPTTGGYPVIGVIDERDLGALVQARPGGFVRLQQVTRAREGGAVA